MPAEVWYGGLEPDESDTYSSENWLQERVREKQLRIERVDSEVNPSDIGTKYLDTGRIIKLMDSVNLKICRSQTAAGLACLEDLPLAGE